MDIEKELTHVAFLNREFHIWHMIGKWRFLKPFNGAIWKLSTDYLSHWIATRWEHSVKTHCEI